MSTILKESAWGDAFSGLMSAAEPLLWAIPDKECLKQESWGVDAMLTTGGGG